MIYFDESSIRYYKNYHSIPTDDGLQFRLPDFFPKNSSDLNSFINLDLNIWDVEFSLSDSDAKIFEESLNEYSNLELEKEKISFIQDIAKVCYKNGKIQEESVIFTVVKINKKLNNRYIIFESESNSQCIVKS